MQKVAIRLRDLIGDVDLIVSSPYVRARQTAEVLAQIFFDVKDVEAPELVPHSPPQAFLRWLKAHGREVKSMLVVGHEPQLSVFGAYLMAAKTESLFELKKSAVACLETADAEDLEPATAELLWLIPPKIWAD
jgi:phosphohistidine phosphatase